MRILHVITSLRTGGAERLVTDMLPRLRARGHDAELLLFDGTRTPLLEQLEKEGITVRSLGRGAFQMRNPLHLFRLHAFLKKHRYDIVHTHNTACQLLTAMAVPADGPVLVTTEHNTFNRRRNWRWYRAADRWMYGRYSHIICVGERTRNNMDKLLDGSRCKCEMSVVPNGIDLARFTDAVPDSSLRLACEMDKHVIIMVSAFRPEKDQPTLIRAMKHLSDDYVLWLVGGWHLRASCERLVESLALGGRVRFWGVRQDVPALFASADVVVQSSRHEGLSLSVIEAMAVGKPVIASDVDGMYDTVGDAGLLFPFGDDRRLAGMIRSLCENRDLYDTTALRCRTRAMQFDIDRVVRSCEELYGQLLIKRQNDKNNCKS